MTNRILLAALLLAACSKTDPTLAYKFEQVDKKLDALNKKIDQVVAQGGARPTRPQQPAQAAADPGAVYSVNIADAPVKGPATAKVTIVEAGEFACPFCRMAQPTLERIAKEYPNDVRFAFKHFVVHPQVAMTPALATCAAQKQGKFWEMETAIWGSAWEMTDRPRMKDQKLLGQENMEALAKNIGLNMDKFKTDMAGQPCKDLIAQQQQQMSQVGVDGTPGFFVNGRPLSGAQPFENFKSVIDEEIKKADEAIKKGTKAEEYYQKAVVEAGKKARG
jgi:protein-disulfide isomerase